MTSKLAEQFHVELWAQTRNEENIRFEGVPTSAAVEGAVDEVMIHAFAPGEASGAVVTLAFSPAEAERLALDLIRVAKA